MTYVEGNTMVSEPKSDIYSLHNNITVNRACSSVSDNGRSHNG